MAIYGDLAKLGRVKLPSGTSYALIDVDGRAIIASNYTSETIYGLNDYVIYGDNLYRRISDSIGHQAPTNSSYWSQVTVGGELKKLFNTATEGIHYRGKTSNDLYDGATTNPITILPNSTLIAEAGDLVIVSLEDAASEYTVNAQYDAHEYIKHTTGEAPNQSISYYIVQHSFTASNWEHDIRFLGQISGNPEFLFDGSTWAMLGGIGEGLGDLAFKDTASGTYVKPTGSGTVNVNVYTANTSKLVTTTIIPTDGTISATYISSSTTASFATKGDTKTFAVRDSTITYYGKADVGTAVNVGTALSGTTSFNTDAIKNASLTGTTTFNTNAISAASLTGTKTFNTDAIKATVDGDMLTFVVASTGTVGISTTAASTGTVGISTTAAGKASVTLTTSSITPAKDCGTAHSIYGTSGTDTVIGVAGEATAITGLTYTTVTPAARAREAITLATGSIAANGSGATIATGISGNTSSATVTVGTSTSTVTVG